MGDYESTPEILDGEQHLIAAAYHILKALESKNLSNDVRRLIADFDIHLSPIARFNEGEVENYREIEDGLTSAQHTIMNLHSNHSKIWDSSPAIVLQYLQAVNDVQKLLRSLENVPLRRSRRVKELLDQAQSVLQMAMARLQDELIHILLQNKRCFEQEQVSYRSNEEAPVSDESMVFNEDDSVENASPRESSSTEIEEYVLDLVHPDLIPEIKSIADIMFASGYTHEFCQAFVGFWKGSLAEYLTVLDMEQLSIEDVFQMEWEYLNKRIRKWRRAIKNFVGVYLASTKRLFDQVIGNHGRFTSLTCLIDASKASMFSLLSFGHAVAIGPHRPERLYCLLDMYEVLAALIPDLEYLFPLEIGSSFRTEFHELLTSLGDSATVIFKGLHNNIASCPSTTPYPNGGVHPLTKYVMNYILCFAEYGNTLSLLLQAQESENSDRGESSDACSNISCPVADHLQFLMSVLEANLENKSNLYNDSSLKHIFMMNNIHYMVQKIRNSKIITYFGAEWIKTHIAKFRKHAMNYERFTWGSILPLIGDDGKTSKATLKARCRDFSAAFEEVYKNQTRWCVPDYELREELRISASKTVIHAYRSFVSKISRYNCEKHIKYTEQDLEIYILDLLEGSSKSLSRSKKR